MFYVADYLRILKANYSIDNHGNKYVNPKKTGLSSELWNKDGNKGKEQIG